MTKENQNMAMAKVKPNWDFWGLIDASGSYVLEPICQTISNWKEGIARLEKVSTNIDVGGNWTNHYNGQYGFINASGKMITDFSFGYANDFSTGLAAVNKNKKWGFIDTSGLLAIHFQFENIRDFQVEGCGAMLNNKWGLINRNGNWILENVFEHLSGFTLGMAVAETKSNFFSRGRHKFIIDAKGNNVIDLPKEWEWSQPVSETLIMVGSSSGYPGERIYGFMNLNGKIVCQPQFYTDSDSFFDIGEFNEGMLKVRDKKGLNGFININGKIAIPLQFQFANTFSNGVAKVSINNKTFFIDKNGNKVDYSEPVEIKRPFDEVLEFSEGLAVARKDELWGVIDENNSVITDFRFKRRFLRTAGDAGDFFSEYLPKYSCGLIGINEERNNNTYAGYLDKAGKIAIDLRYRIAEPFILN